MSTTSVGIDIGSFSVKVAKVRSTNRGYECIGTSEYPLSQDPNKDTQIELIEILRDIHSRYIDDGASVVIGAHQFEVSWRRREFPFKERHKILKSLPFELEDDIPFSSENSVFDARITHFTGNKAQVIAVACPKEHLIKTLKRVEDVGVSADIISVDGFAFANLFEEWREAPWTYPALPEPGEHTNAERLATPEPAQVDLAINIGHRVSTVTVIKDGYLLDLRHIDWGGRDLAELISQRYSISYLEALKELKRKAYILMNNEGASREQVALSEVVKSAVDIFTQKLRLTLFELKNLYKVQYRQGILVGGVAQLRNLGPYLTQRTEVAINRLARLDMIPSIDFGQSPNGEVALVTAIGLAIEGIKRPKNPPLNLLRGEFAKQSQSLQFFWDRWGQTMKVVAAAFIVLCVWSFLRDDFTSSNIDASSDALHQQAKNVLGTTGPRITNRTIHEFIKEQNEKAKLRKMLDSLQNMNSPLDVMTRLTALEPLNKSFGPKHNLTGLNVEDLRINGEDVVLTGQAASTQIIAHLEQVLKSIARDGKVHRLPVTMKTEKSYQAFRYRLRVGRRTGG